MADASELAHFLPLVGDTFTVPAAGIELVLAEAERAPASSGGRRAEAFSLVFSGPPDLALAQGTHHLDHAGLGGFDVFLVPLGPTTYQAVFN